jgi:hypothetical protein
MEQCIQLLQVLVDSLRLLPLLEYYHSNLVPHPLSKLIEESFHTTDSEVVNPSPDDLVHLDEGVRKFS